MTSPTQRTLEYLRARGWSAWVVEKWIPRTKQRIDLFGFGDILAFKGACVLIVQATTRAHAAERQAKIEANPKEPRHVLTVRGVRSRHCPLLNNMTLDQFFRGYAVCGWSRNFDLSFGV